MGGEHITEQHSGEYPTRVRRTVETAACVTPPYIPDSAWHVEHIFRDGRIVDWNVVQDRCCAVCDLALCSHTDAEFSGQFADSISSHLSTDNIQSGASHA